MFQTNEKLKLIAKVDSLAQPEMGFLVQVVYQGNDIGKSLGGTEAYRTGQEKR